MDKTQRKGSWALVSGTSSGIGREICFELAKDGVNIVMVARRLERMKTLAKDLEAKYQIKTLVIQKDLIQPDAHHEIIKEIEDQGIEIQILVNNSGRSNFKPFFELDLKTHLDTYQLNLNSLVSMSYVFGKHMLAHKKSSHILNVCSLIAFQPCALQPTYSASKSAVLVFTECIRHELSETNINVTCLCPGGANTEIMEKGGKKITAWGNKFMQSANFVAVAGLEAMFAKKAVVVPGLTNKIAAISSRFLSRELAMKFSVKAMGKATQPSN